MANSTGNSFNSAQSIALTTTQTTRSGTLNHSNSNIFYSVRLRRASDLSLDLNGGSAKNLGLQLLNQKRQVVQTINLRGKQRRSIDRRLESGRYFVRVFTEGGSTRYQLNLSAVPDSAGNTSTTARRLGNLSSTSVQDWLSKGDRDYYQIRMGDRSQFSLALINLTADAKVQLLNRSDSLIRTATGESGKSKFLNLTLEPGTYYVRVIPTRLTSKTRYTLNLAATPLSSEPLPALPAINLASRASGFNKPVHITSAKDGSNRLFVVEQDGRIRILQNGTVLNTPFLDIADRVRSAGEEGLLSVAFPPDYARKGYFYVYYTNSAGNNVVSRFRTTNTNVAAPNSEQVILTLNHPTFANHNGGQLAFGLDGYLYIGTGDGGGGGDPNNNAQNPNSLLGKILRIDVESPDTATYTIPTTNPFVGAKDLQNRVRDEIWALGLRNPWRFSFDRQTNDLFIADVGQNAYEEVNFQVGSSTGGENYGWRVLEGVHRFNNSTEDITGFVLPIAEYDHSQGESVTGGFVYRGTTESALRGVYFYGDFISGKLWGVRQNGSQWTNQLLLESPYLISSFGEDEQGNLYLTDYAGGGVYQITT